MNPDGCRIINLRRVLSSVWVFCWVRAVPEQYLSRMVNRRHFWYSRNGRD
jgi:hypothetical protein